MGRKSFDQKDFLKMCEQKSYAEFGGDLYFLFDMCWFFGFRFFFEVGRIVFFWVVK